MKCYDQGTAAAPLEPETPVVALVALSPNVAISADDFANILTAIGENIPKIKSLIASLEKSPAMVSVLSMLFPGVAGILPLLQQLGPWMDFLAELDQAILDAIKSK